MRNTETSVVTLPGDDRPRTGPVDVSPDFAGIPPANSFDALAAEIVSAIERWHPGGEGNPPSAASAAVAAETTGTVVARQRGLSDDSVAGYEYVVTAGKSGGQWTVMSATRSAICHRGVTDGLCT